MNLEKDQIKYIIQQNDKNMRKKIIILGGSGLIGRNLIPKLLIEGFEVLNIDIHKLKFSDQNYKFKKLDLIKNHLNSNLFENSKAVINLIGYPINKRWNKKNMKLIYDSRIISNQKLVSTIEKCDKKPQTLISASGISVYRKDSKKNTEESKTDNRFISNLVKDWEYPILENSGTRNICLRQGYVLAKNGGLFETIIKPYKYLVSIQAFKDKQIIPFIHIDDLTEIYTQAVKNKDYQGVINAVSPEKLNSSELFKLIEKVKHPFFHIHIPFFILKSVFKEFANEITTSIDVEPSKLQKLRFKFKYSHPSTCILNLLQK